MSTDFGDFTVSCLVPLNIKYTDFSQPMDLGGWFDDLDFTGAELWDPDLFGNLPTLP